MTINEAIDALDAGHQNTFTRQEKLRWLSWLDGRIWRQIQGKTEPFPGYSLETDPETVLLAPTPWDEIYLQYMQAQMDRANGELDRYENSAALFNTGFAAYRNYFNRTNAPQGRHWRYF